MDDKQFNTLMHTLLGIQSAILTAEIHRLPEGDDDKYAKMLFRLMAGVLSEGLEVEKALRESKDL